MADSCGANSKMRTLNIVDTFSRECVAIVVGRSLPASGVIDALRNLRKRGVYRSRSQWIMGLSIRQGVLKEWAQSHGIKLNYITPGKPMENGYVESFNGKFGEECLNQHSFRSVREAREIIERWRIDYNERRQRCTS